MKVWINGKVTDTKETPIVVILTEQDRKNIANMIPGATLYCMYDTDTHSQEEIEKLLTELKEKEENASSTNSN